MKDRPPSYDAVYVPPHHRLRSGVSSARSHFSISSLPHCQTGKQLNNKTNNNINHDNNDNYNNFSCNDNSKNSQSNSAYSDGESEEESDRELEMSLQPRRGRAGSVQPGKCYHLYPRCVYDAFPEYQLPEILRTPLQSLCLQTKSLRLGSISKFLSRALQSPELLAVENAIEYLKINWGPGPE